MSRSAIILCGGLASRLGFADKPLLPLAGHTILEHVLASVQDVVDDVVAVARDEVQAEKIMSVCSVPVGVDRVRDFGPVAGVLSGLEYVSSDWVLISGCDMPLVNREVIRLLFDRTMKYDAAIPRWSGGKIEPLHAVYNRKALLPVIREAIDTGNHEMYNCIKMLKRVNYVPVEDLRNMDPELQSFINVNTPEDLERVRNILEDDADS
jgi:molybdopterin-guanine dinucleotide biosynthesis protein A